MNNVKISIEGIRRQYAKYEERMKYTSPGFVIVSFKEFKAAMEKASENE